MLTDLLNVLEVSPFGSGICAWPRKDIFRRSGLATSVLFTLPTPLPPFPPTQPKFEGIWERLVTLPPTGAPLPTLLPNSSVVESRCLRPEGRLFPSPDRKDTQQVSTEQQRTVRSMRQEVPSIQYTGTGRKSKTHNGIARRKKGGRGAFPSSHVLFVSCPIAALCDGVAVFLFSICVRSSNDVQSSRRQDLEMYIFATE